MTRKWKQQNGHVSFVEGMTNDTTINNIQKQSIERGHTLRIEFFYFIITKKNATHEIFGSYLRFSRPWVWVLLSSEMWRRLVWQNCTDVFEFHDAVLPVTYTRIHGVVSKKSARFKSFFGRNETKSKIYILRLSRTHGWWEIFYRIPIMKPHEIEAMWRKPWMEDTIKMHPKEN